MRKHADAQRARDSGSWGSPPPSPDWDAASIPWRAQRPVLVPRSRRDEVIELRLIRNRLDLQALTGAPDGEGPEDVAVDVERRHSRDYREGLSVLGDLECPV